MRAALEKEQLERAALDPTGTNGLWVGNMKLGPGTKRVEEGYMDKVATCYLEGMRVGTEGNRMNHRSSGNDADLLNYANQKQAEIAPMRQATTQAKIQIYGYPGNPNWAPVESVRWKTRVGRVLYRTSVGPQVRARGGIRWGGIRSVVADGWEGKAPKTAAGLPVVPTIPKPTLDQSGNAMDTDGRSKRPLNFNDTQGDSDDDDEVLVPGTQLKPSSQGKTTSAPTTSKAPQTPKPTTPKPTPKPRYGPKDGALYAQQELDDAGWTGNYYVQDGKLFVEKRPGPNDDREKPYYEPIAVMHNYGRNDDRWWFSDSQEAGTWAQFKKLYPGDSVYAYDAGRRTVYNAKFHRERKTQYVDDTKYKDGVPLPDEEVDDAVYSTPGMNPDTDPWSPNGGPSDSELRKRGSYGDSTVRFY